MSISIYKDVKLDSDIDAELARKMRNSYPIRKWCRQYSLITYDEQRLWEEKILKDPTIKMFSVRASLSPGHAPSHQVGVAGFTSIDRQNRSAEFSLYIGQEYQHRGFGELALKTLLYHGFKDWGFNRIWGESFDGNPAMKLFMKLGFSICGLNRQSYFREGKFIDSHLFDLLLEEYNGP